MSLGVSIKFFGSLMDLLLPWILAYIIDAIIPTKNVSAIFLWGGVMLLCSVIAVVTNILANRMASSVARDATGNIRHDLFAKVAYLSIPQIEQVGIPSLVSRLTTDISWSFALHISCRCYHFEARNPIVCAIAKASRHASSHRPGKCDGCSCDQSIIESRL